MATNEIQSVKPLMDGDAETVLQQTEQHRLCGPLATISEDVDDGVKQGGGLGFVHSASLESRLQGRQVG